MYYILPSKNIPSYLEDAESINGVIIVESLAPSEELFILASSITQQNLINLLHSWNKNSFQTIDNGVRTTFYI